MAKPKNRSMVDRPSGSLKKYLGLPPGEDFWVFGYGSLMWKPGFPHIEVRPGRLYGYHRRFCIFSHRYRGTREVPGLVFGLDRGGSCRGLAFKVPAGEADAVMDYLQEREMVTGVYDPGWVRVATDRGPLRAASFIVDQSHEQYAGRLELPDMVRLVCQGKGSMGACREYLENTVHHLEALGLSDPHLKRLLKAVRAEP